MKWDRALINHAERMGWIHFPKPVTYPRREATRTVLCDCGNAVPFKKGQYVECDECKRKNATVEHNENRATPEWVGTEDEANHRVDWSRSNLRKYAKTYEYTH